MHPLPCANLVQSQLSPSPALSSTPQDDALPNATHGPIQWDRSLFHNAETPDRSCPEIIDLTGPKRHVIFGPFILLAAGLWRASMELELCEDAARRHLVLQFGDERDFSSAELPYLVSGRIRVSIEHYFKVATLAEARVLLAKAAFHGALRFFGVEVERVG